MCLVNDTSASKKNGNGIEKFIHLIKMISTVIEKKGILRGQKQNPDIMEHGNII